MNNTLISFLLMGGAIVIMGALLGFQGIKIGPKDLLRFPDSWPIWVLIYYIGALMYDHGNDLEHCVAYAFLTIIFGFVLTLVASIFWLVVFAGLKRCADWYSGMVRG